MIPRLLDLAHAVNLPETAWEPHLRRADGAWVLSVPSTNGPIMTLKTHHFAETLADLRCVTGTVVPNIATATTPEDALALIEAHLGLTP